MIISFIKELDSKWYAVLPNYEGMHEDLEMVNGANKFLDTINDGSDFVSLDIQLQPTNDCYSYMDMLNHDAVGATYKVHNFEYNDQLWLCNVVHFILGEHPKTIYFRVLEYDL